MSDGFILGMFLWLVVVPGLLAFGLWQEKRLRNI